MKKQSLIKKVEPFRSEPCDLKMADDMVQVTLVMSKNVWREIKRDLERSHDMGSGADTKPKEIDLKTSLLKAETRIKILQESLTSQIEQYRRLFDYWNDKDPGALSEYLCSL